MKGATKRQRTGLIVLIICATTCLPLFSQELKQDPQQLVRSAIANEIAANKHPTKHFFRSRRQNPKGTATRLYVETKDAIAAMLVDLNDQPLTPAQQASEDRHLSWLMNNPEQLRKKKARESEDAERTMGIVRALPDAFLYKYAGTETGSATVGKAGDELVRLSFTPNPSYSPPTRVEQVLTGMEGFLLIDPHAMRLARIDGTLFRDVTFGWGIFGRLDKGGRFVVTQADLGDGSWDITEMKLNITGKILLFKGLSMISDESISDFRRVPDTITFAQGVEMLKAEQKTANAGHVDKPKSPQQ